MKTREEFEGKIILAIHSRIYPLSNKCSATWTRIGKGFESFFLSLFPYIMYLIVSIRENYHDMEEYVELVEKVISKKPDVIVLPLTPKMGEHENRLLKILQEFKGQVVAINVPPNPKALKALKGKLRGYVGPNEVAFGTLAGKKLFEGQKPNIVYVPCDKPEHYGYQLRIRGLKKIAKKNNIHVCIINMNNQKTANIIIKMMEANSAFFTLGIVGTEFALKAKESHPDKVSKIVAIDTDGNVIQNIKNGNILCALIQDPEAQGYKAAKLAMSILREETSVPYTKIYCGPEVVDLNNISQYEQP